MSLTLYAHPFSSYSQKVLIALWENGTPFAYRHMEEPGAGEELVQLWPIGKFPVLLDGSSTIVETSIIIEHLDHYHPGSVRFLPEDPIDALEVRLLDRFFDQHVMNAAQVAVNESLRQTADRLDEAKQTSAAALERAYSWLERRLADREWAAGNFFSLADCAAAPSLFYADWVHPIDSIFPKVRAYRARLLARPSFCRAVEEGRRYRSYFPLGAPDRD
ncbi:glutathione S-transferase family protein [Sphingomonas aliaeris]|uniref:Glutathione S-transferase family protein n=1 Tax=Sphingomonas aliaeris TaxID=2759526 RepID=A0A974NWD6_9SPHN|nr:glutathione S-transferase family protein [Sphingomonas aliaeris]QQV78007.1 glutathione S-transferase family protein [Sphingomonas aliaeris]